MARVAAARVQRPPSARATARKPDGRLRFLVDRRRLSLVESQKPSSFRFGMMGGQGLWWGCLPKVPRHRKESGGGAGAGAVVGGASK